MTQRVPLDEAGLGTGKKARLRRILFQHGLRNGTAMFLPYDQGLEHGPRDFFANPAASDPRYIIRLAVEGGFNGIAIQIGLAEKFYWDYAGEVPLILKLNGKTDIPSDAEALSPLHASVADAVRLGADAVGYTLYVGTPAAEQDFAQLRQVRADAHAARHAADRVGVPARRGDRGQGRQGLLLRGRLRRPDRQRARRRRGQGELPAPGEARPPSPRRTTRSSPASRRSTRWSGRPTARWCSSPAANGPATTRCWRRPASRWRPARPD